MVIISDRFLNTVLVLFFVFSSSLLFDISIVGVFVLKRGGSSSPSLHWQFGEVS